MLRQYELVDLVKSYDPEADEDALNRAYVFAMKKHGAQLRTSGDPYYSHPIEVVYIILTKTKLWKEPYNFASSDKKNKFIEVLTILLLPLSFIAISFILWNIR